MGRGGQQQHVIGAVAQQFAEPVALAFVGLVAGRHAVRLIDDDQIPMHLLQPGQDLGALGEVERGDDLLLLQPLVDPELVADIAALHHQKRLVEFFPEFPLPLERQVRGADDEHPFNEAAELEFADEEAGHDGLARPRIVGEQEAHGGQLEEVLVHGFELVRQRIYARDGKPEIGIELVGNAERVGLEADSQELPVAVVGKGRVGDGQAGKVVRGERDLTEPL